MIGSSTLVFSTKTAEHHSGHKPVHCCLPPGHRQPIFLPFAAPSHAQLQHTLGGFHLCTCVSARRAQIGTAGTDCPSSSSSRLRRSRDQPWPLLGLVAAVLWAGHLCLYRLYRQSWARAQRWDPGRLCPNCVTPSSRGGDGLCSLLCAGCCVAPPGSALLPGRWIFPVPRLSVCRPLCSALGSPPVPTVPCVLPRSTRSIQQFPWWQAAQETELE